MRNDVSIILESSKEVSKNYKKCWLQFFAVSKGTQWVWLIRLANNFRFDSLNILYFI